MINPPVLVDCGPTSPLEPQLAYRCRLTIVRVRDGRIGGKGTFYWSYQKMQSGLNYRLTVLL